MPSFESLLRTTILLLLVVALSFQEVPAQSFAPTSDKITGVIASSIKWADYDNDGSLDVILSGLDSSGSEVTKIYQNINGTFEEIAINLPQLDYTAIDWGDFDNDDDLDFVISGSESGILCPPCLTQIFQNDHGTFFRYEADMVGVFAGDAHWVDFDGDNDLDLYVTGIDGNLNADSSKIYRNENGSFVDIKADITHIHQGKSDWGDYDNDGDPDLIVSGFTLESVSVLKLFNNDLGYFREVIEESFYGIFNGSASWGDYDNDGDLDILALGSTNYFPARIYENQQCGFEPIELDSNILGGVAAWGDYDVDGDLDILVSGFCDCFPAAAVLSPLTKIYQNVNGFFTDADLELTQLDQGSVAWADFDNDGDSDFIISGLSTADIVNDPTNVKYQTIVYENNLKEGPFKRNTPPAPPANLETTITGNSVNLSWDAASDLETEDVVLTYNIYIEDLGRNKFFVSPHSNPGNGYRKVVSPGNTGYNKYFQMENLPKGQYAWSVQAVDNGFLASGFAQRQLFSINSDTMVPNVITPKGDGINEKFIIGSVESGWTLDVINRWGDPVYHSENYHNNWGGNELSSGVYFYTLRNKCREVQDKGALSILH